MEVTWKQLALISEISVFTNELSTTHPLVRIKKP